MNTFGLIRGFAAHKVREWTSGKRAVPIAEGERGPEFLLKDDSGVEHRLSEYRGRKVILFFFPRASTPG